MSDNTAKQLVEKVNALGFSSVTFYNMGGTKEDYLVYGANSVKIREQWDAILDVPFFPCVSIGWDDTPRFPAKGVRDVVHYHNTPGSFAMLLPMRFSVAVMSRPGDAALKKSMKIVPKQVCRCR